MPGFLDLTTPNSPHLKYVPSEARRACPTLSGMASDNEDAHDYQRKLAEHSGTPKRGAAQRFPFPEYSAKTDSPRVPPVELTDDEKRALTLFGGGSWHAGSSEVLPDGGDVCDQLASPRRRPSLWIRLRLWLGIDRRR